MNATHLIARFVEGFFHDYLAGQRGLSRNTIVSYRDALKLFLRFARERLGKPVDKLTVEDVDHQVVTAFLEHLEVSRGNSPRTRNNRLAALHSFFRYVGEQEPLLLGRSQRICAIPLKRTEHRTIDYLEDQELRALLESVDQSSRNGRRDYALLLFLYNTGARVQEAVDLERTDLRLEAPFQVRLTGKGNKERVCPLWPETVAALQTYLGGRDPDPADMPSVFVNAQGRPITRFGIRYIVRRHGAQAAQSCPSIQAKRLSPHLLRHSTAMHLLQSGNDLSVVKDWMGHADLNTTHGYVEIDMKMKRKALQAAEAPHVKTPASRRSKWLQPGILQWLDELSKEASIMCSTAPTSATVKG